MKEYILKPEGREWTTKEWSIDRGHYQTNISLETLDRIRKHSHDVIEIQLDLKKSYQVTDRLTRARLFLAPTSEHSDGWRSTSGLDTKFYSIGDLFKLEMRKIVTVKEINLDSVIL